MVWDLTPIVKIQISGWFSQGGGARLKRRVQKARQMALSSPPLKAVPLYNLHGCSPLLGCSSLWRPPNLRAFPNSCSQIKSVINRDWCLSQIKKLLTDQICDKPRQAPLSSDQIVVVSPDPNFLKAERAECNLSQIINMSLLNEGACKNCIFVLLILTKWIFSFTDL